MSFMFHIQQYSMNSSHQRRVTKWRNKTFFSFFSCETSSFMWNLFFSCETLLFFHRRRRLYNQIRKLKKKMWLFWRRKNSYNWIPKMNMIKYRICNILTKTRFLKILFWFERMCVFWNHENVRKIYVKIHEFCMNNVKCVNIKLSWMNKK